MNISMLVYTTIAGNQLKIQCQATIVLVILYSQPCALLFQFIHSITPKYTTQFNSYLRFVQKKNRIILLLTFKSLQLPSLLARYKLYSKRYFIIFTNTKGLQLFPESSFVWYHLWNNVANLLYTSNNAILL